MNLTDKQKKLLIKMRKEKLYVKWEKINGKWCLYDFKTNKKIWHDIRKTTFEYLHRKLLLVLSVSQATADYIYILNPDFKTLIDSL